MNVRDQVGALHQDPRTVVAGLAGPQLKFHGYSLAEPSSDVPDLLDEIDRDPTAIFLG